MTVPLILLGIGSVIGGLVLNNWIGGWLNPAVGGEEAEAPGLIHVTPIGVITMVVVLAGVAVSFRFFGPRREIPQVQPASRSFFTVAGRRDLYGDAFNEAFLMRPGQQLTNTLAYVDADGVDGAVRGTSNLFAGVSLRLRRWQSGFVRSYALTMVAGAAVVGIVLILGRLS